MAKKVPGPFKKPINEKNFEKKFLKHIQHPGDKKFLKSCFTLSDGMYTVKDNLDDEAVKKMKVLLKAVKTNRKGAVNVLPLALAVLLVGGIVFFVTVLMNPLLEKALERGLELVFEAKSDVSGFRLSITKVQVKFNSLTVANRDSPMKNLFEMGRTEFRMNPRALLMGKINIEEMRADSLRFGTDRKVSGALPYVEPKPKKEKVQSDMPPLVDLKNFDAKALLDREIDKLTTPKAYEEAAKAYNDAVVKWQGQISAVEDRTKELQDRAAPVMAINVNQLNNVETITATIKDITALVTSVKGAVDDANNLVNGIQADVNTAMRLEQTARNAINQDVAHLKSYIDFKSGAALSALEPSIREILSDQAQQYIDYGVRALEVLEKLKEKSAEAPKKEKEKKVKQPAFKGRTVYFPTKQYPQFYIGILASDFTIPGWNWAIDIRGISTDPDLSDEATTLALTARETGNNPVEVAAKAGADFRTKSTELFNASVNGKGFAVSIGDYLKQAGIGGFNGVSSFTVSFGGTKTGNISGGGDIAITQAKLVEPTGTLAVAIDEAMRSFKSVDMQIGYEHIKDGKDSFTLKTNLTNLVGDIVKRTAEQYINQATKEIERVVKDYVSSQLEGTLGEKADLDQLLAIAKGDKAALDKLTKSLEDKQAEFEKKIKGAAEEAAEKAQQQAKDALQNSLKDAQIPKLPFGR